MKVSVSLPDDDVEFLDAYAEREGVPAVVGRQRAQKEGEPRGDREKDRAQAAPPVRTRGLSGFWRAHPTIVVSVRD